MRWTRHVNKGHVYCLDTNNKTRFETRYLAVPMVIFYTRLWRYEVWQRQKAPWEAWLFYTMEIFRTLSQTQTPEIADRTYVRSGRYICRMKTNTQPCVFREWRGHLILDIKSCHVLTVVMVTHSRKPKCQLNVIAIR